MPDPPIISESTVTDTIYVTVYFTSLFQAMKILVEFYGPINKWIGEDERSAENSDMTSQ